MLKTIEEILDLETIDDDLFRGHVVPSKLKRTFGGQVAAQALSAAIRTVSDGKLTHSLHGYFMLPGKANEPTLFRVDRLRDGASFATRRVDAIQHGRTIFSMNVSFHRTDDEGLEHADTMRDVPRPEEVGDQRDQLPVSSRLVLAEWADWDIRVVPQGSYHHDPQHASSQVVWFKSKRRLPDDPKFHLCTLAYMSDMTLLYAARVPHPHHEIQMASLDHAMWFLRPFRADEWLLYDQSSPSAHGGRALTQGRIFDQEGTLVAVVTQEGLTRTLRP